MEYCSVRVRFVHVLLALILAVGFSPVAWGASTKEPGRSSVKKSVPAGKKSVQAGQKTPQMIWGFGLVTLPYDAGSSRGSALQGRLEYKSLLVELLLGAEAGQSEKSVSSNAGTQQVMQNNLALSSGLRLGWIVKKAKQYQLYPALTAGALYQKTGTDWQAGGFGRLGLGFDYLLPGARQIAINFEAGASLRWLDQTLSYGTRASPFGLLGVTWRFLK